MLLPQDFLDKMKQLLGNEFQSFVSSYQNPRLYGLRINTLKVSVETFLKISPFKLHPVPWTRDGFYYEEGERPGKHPFYHAGLYYIQEPSAMAPAEILDAQPGEKILDLCAAPGGKTIQLAAGLKGKGLLVANDNHPDRAKALLKNIELYGVTNAIVTNETPDRLAKVFPSYFDKILIDAPCSGEGMFRKEPDMIKSWDVHSVEACMVKQKSILEQAIPMLRPGGKLLYSTCTFSPEENEGMIAQFLEKHDEFRLIDISLRDGFSPGRKDWANTDFPMEKTVRLWPHQIKGEGHYMALLEKSEESLIVQEKIREREISGSQLKNRNQDVLTKQEKEWIDQFMKQTIIGSRLFDADRFVKFKDHILIQPDQLPDLKGLRVVRGGWHIGTLKKNRFEPSHGLIMGLPLHDIRKTINFSSDDSDLTRYLKGETLFVEGENGWIGIGVEGFPLGWGKRVSGQLKNEYPPGWRWVG
ncbi:RsmB/NOP family class I SAM-dependent RNA methyltransferase [Microaerobacter geothermalis]|uniref:RsmF rRNA methyltransferase first C-terminal domain-containing protein n=1 Tax=Microaerobacter geothermalis TaxID=674972 RepID=UPI001F18BB39|nr:RsmB/NOP family class I SAM-dependent RNA methyltransferase [Microaerobacter geothermalis]MCF6093931.1 RsmB/NOP family class I SAM-dependent RNA methyltransferase [Microaerobacter geothermalis]